MEIVSCWRCGKPRILCNIKHFVLGWIWPLVWGSAAGGAVGAAVYYGFYVVGPWMNSF